MLRDGTQLTNLYTLPTCTPSRSALMTGRYPFRFGLQRGYGDMAPNGLPTGIKLLPSYLKDLGYSTHALGKWHLGHCDQRYTPTLRGFDTFLGSVTGATDHWSRDGGTVHNRGYDFRNNTVETHHGEGKLSSKLFSDEARKIMKKKSEKPYFLYLAFTMIHSPFQDVSKNSRPVKHVTKDVRNGMIKALDNAVGEILKAVDENTVVIFMSDNGGRNFPEENIRPNLPLRGGKAEVYEGGTKVVGYIQGPGIRRRVQYDGLMHMVDWLPTLLSLAGADQNDVSEDVDGVNMMSAIVSGDNSPRRDMVYNIDERNFHDGPGASDAVWQYAVRRGDLKLIWGEPRKLSRPEGRSRNSRYLLKLYDLHNDPNEQVNLAQDEEYKHKLEELKSWSLKLASEMVLEI